MNSKLLDILVCPMCKGPLEHEAHGNELLCKPCRLAYSVRDDIPVMLEEKRASCPLKKKCDPVRSGDRNQAKKQPAVPAASRSLNALHRRSR